MASSHASRLSVSKPRRSWKCALGEHATSQNLAGVKTRQRIVTIGKSVKMRRGLHRLAERTDVRRE